MEERRRVDLRLLLLAYPFFEAASLQIPSALKRSKCRTALLPQPVLPRQSEAPAA